MTHFIAGDEPITFASEMELRDYFASHAMQAICIRENLPIAYKAVMAEDAYKLADAMMKARERE